MSLFSPTPEHCPYHRVVKTRGVCCWCAAKPRELAISKFTLTVDDIRLLKRANISPGEPKEP